MQEVVKVNDKQIVAVEWNGERVITTAQLAEVYGTDVNNVQNNFANNKERFKEETHYYLLTGEELKKFKNLVNNIDLVAKKTSQLYLWTRRGASRHCKILDTDKAWQQFDCLEENYFNPQTVHSITYQYPVSPAAMESATNAGRLLERIMRRESAAPHEVAYVVKQLFNQVGIDIPECVVKIPTYEQIELQLTSLTE
jgi:hypothetical protein